MQKNCPHRLHKEVFTPRNSYAQKLYPEQLLGTETFPHRSIYGIYAQKSLRTEVFMPSSFYTGLFTHWSLYTEKLLHTEASAHSTLLHTANFYTERLCFPFLITYLSRSPSQVHKFFRAGPLFWLITLNECYDLGKKSLGKTRKEISLQEVFPEKRMLSSA